MDGVALKPQDGKKDKLLPALDRLVTRLGSWECVVRVLWDPPEDECGKDGRKLGCSRALSESEADSVGEEEEGEEQEDSSVGVH
eukprot:scaffold85067_cov27-Tisochrysis_lutea.AAC.1